MYFRYTGGGDKEERMTQGLKVILNQTKLVLIEWCCAGPVWENGKEWISNDLYWQPNKRFGTDGKPSEKTGGDEPGSDHSFISKVSGAMWRWILEVLQETWPCLWVGRWQK